MGNYTVSLWLTVRIEGTQTPGLVAALLRVFYLELARVRSRNRYESVAIALNADGYTIAVFVLLAASTHPIWGLIYISGRKLDVLAKSLTQLG